MTKPATGHCALLALCLSAFACAAGGPGESPRETISDEPREPVVSDDAPAAVEPQPPFRVDPLEPSIDRLPQPAPVTLEPEPTTPDAPELVEPEPVVDVIVEPAPEPVVEPAPEPEPLGLYDACETEMQCPAELTCMTSTHEELEGWVCRPRPERAINEPCSDDDECPSGLCVQSILPDVRVCSEPLPMGAGAYCESGDQCATGRCEWIQPGYMGCCTFEGGPCFQ